MAALGGEAQTDERWTAAEHGQVFLSLGDSGQPHTVPVNGVSLADPEAHSTSSSLGSVATTASEPGATPANRHPMIFGKDSVVQTDADAVIAALEKTRLSSDSSSPPTPSTGAEMTPPSSVANSGTERPSKPLPVPQPVATASVPGSNGKVDELADRGAMPGPGPSSTSVAASAQPFQQPRSAPRQVPIPQVGMPPAATGMPMYPYYMQQPGVPQVYGHGTMMFHPMYHSTPGHHALPHHAGTHPAGGTMYYGPAGMHPPAAQSRVPGAMYGSSPHEHSGTSPNAPMAGPHVPAAHGAYPMHMPHAGPSPYAPMGSSGYGHHAGHGASAASHGSYLYQLPPGSDPAALNAAAMGLSPPGAAHGALHDAFGAPAGRRGLPGANPRPGSAAGLYGGARGRNPLRPLASGEAPGQFAMLRGSGRSAMAMDAFGFVHPVDTRGGRAGLGDRDGRPGKRDSTRRYWRDSSQPEASGGSSSSGPVHSPSAHLLADIKAGSKSGARLELDDIRGHLFTFCKDQHGSRFIQQKLETTPNEEVARMFSELSQEETRELMEDVFGNYVVQKLLEHGPEELRAQLIGLLSGNVVRMSCNTYGCRVIQKALEVLPQEGKVALVEELRGSVLRCVRDQNGNHVIQKCIECVLPSDAIEFMVADIGSDVVALAKHNYGCRVVQRCLEHCTLTEPKNKLLDTLSAAAAELAPDQFGNYVMQHILSHGRKEWRDVVVHTLAPLVNGLSNHKYASNVIEKCLKHGEPEEIELMVQKVLDAGSKRALELACNMYANYVIQKMLEVASPQKQRALVEALWLPMPDLKRSVYGKHIAGRVEKLYAQKATESEGQGSSNSKPDTGNEAAAVPGASGTTQ